jgi:hypothetical protein
MGNDLPFEFISSDLEPSPKNTEYYNELKATFDKALEFLESDEHAKVVNIFSFFFKGDLRFKEKIFKALTPSENGKMPDPDHLTQITELQGFYNNFHLTLFNDITDRLVELYKIAYDILEKNMAEGSRLSFVAHKTVRQYEIALEKLIAPLDTMQGQLYISLKESYKIVQQRRDQNLSEITKKVLQREEELRNKVMMGDFTQ